MTEKFYKKLPTIINTTLISSHGWLVGSSIDKILSGDKVRDYDIIVPDAQLYQQTVLFLQELVGEPKINTCGGLKFTLPDLEIDIWPEELSHFLLNTTSVKYVFNFKKQLLLKVEG
jgi:hypothetical protein